MSMVTQFFFDDHGQDLAEYALLAAFIGLTAAAAWVAVGNAISTAYGNWDTTEQNLSRVTPPPE